LIIEKQKAVKWIGFHGMDLLTGEQEDQGRLANLVEEQN
jgi:hypothetical protein